MGKHVVVVVHGVGDPKPGDALGRFIGGYSIKSGSTRRGALVPELHEDPTYASASEPGVIPTFEANRGTVSGGKNNTRTELYEVYWGDLSRVKGSLLGLLEGVVDLVFGLRHIVFAAHEELQRHSGPRSLNTAIRTVIFTSTMAMWFVRGPLLAFNLLAALVSAIYMGQLAVGAATTGDGSVLLSVRAGSGLGLLLASLVYRMARKSHWSTTTAETLAVLCAGTMIVAWGWPSHFKDFSDAAQYLTFGISVCALLIAGSILTLAVSSGILCLQSNVQAVSTPFRHAVKQALLVINTCSILSCTLFLFFAMLGWAVVAGRKPAGVGGVVESRIGEALHLFGLVWVMLIAVAVFYGCLMMLSSAQKAKEQPGQSPAYPRYIVHPFAVALIIGFGVVAAVVFIAVILRTECKPLYGLLTHFMPFDTNKFCKDFPELALYKSLVAPFESLDKPALVASTAIGAALLAARAHLGTALDIVLDVIAHFKRPERTVPQALRSRKADDHPSEWSIMLARFSKVLNKAIETHSKGISPLRVTVIAHSQGTMIALEALGVIKASTSGSEAAVSACRQALQGCTKVDLITMGCPLGSLYQHYFPLRYEVQSQQQTLVQRWVNIYRADDFVGTSVGRLVQHGEQPHTFPANERVGPRGHVDYWTDDEVLGHVCTIFGSAPDMKDAAQGGSGLNVQPTAASTSSVAPSPPGPLLPNA